MRFLEPCSWTLRVTSREEGIGAWREGTVAGNSADALRVSSVARNPGRVLGINLILGGRVPMHSFCTRLYLDVAPLNAFRLDSCALSVWGRSFQNI